jgi:hypothetical protein
MWRKSKILKVLQPHHSCTEVATASQLHRGCNRITVAPSKLQGGPRALTKRILDGAMARLDQLHELVREIPTLPRFSVADEFPSTVT